MSARDPHQRPPEHMRNVYKKYQRIKSPDLERDPAIVDLERDIGPPLPSKLRIVDQLDTQRLTATFRRFGGDNAEPAQASKIPVYEHEDMPGR